MLFRSVNTCRATDVGAFFVTALKTSVSSLHTQTLKMEETHIFTLAGVSKETYFGANKLFTCG